MALGRTESGHVYRTLSAADRITRLHSIVEALAGSRVRASSTDPPGPELNLSTLIASLALAAIIAGEAPGCPFEAKLAVAHVAQRNPVWYGNAEPTASDLLAALTWSQYPDPTDGALFLIGPGDAAKMAGLGKRTARFECSGTWLEAYRGT